MIDWGKCVKGDTVIVKSSGEERVFVAEYKDYVWYGFTDARGCYTTYKSNFKSAYIKLDPTRLKEGVSVVVHPNGMRYLFLFMVGDRMIVEAEKCLPDGIGNMVSVHPSVWGKWTIVDDN